MGKVMVSEVKNLEILCNLTDNLKPRQCIPTECSCQGVPNGLFCGDGLLGCVEGHVYQCGDDGQKSCDFGVRESCQICGELECPNGTA